MARTIFAKSVTNLAADPESGYKSNMRTRTAAARQGSKRPLSAPKSQGMNKRMSDDPRTLREAGLAIEGLRNSLAAEIGGISKLVQWTTGIGALVAAFYGYQLYSLNYNVGSLANAVKTTQEQMVAIKTEMAGLRAESKAELGAIRAELTAIRQALKGPEPEPTKTDGLEKQGQVEQSNDRQGAGYAVPSVLKGR